MPVSFPKSLPPDLASEVLDAIAAAGGTRLGVLVTASVDPPEIVFANWALADLLGYELDEFLKLPILSHADPDSAIAIADRRSRRRRGEVVDSSFRSRLRRKDGSHIPVDVTTARAEIGGRPSHVTFVYDVSDRVRATEALAASETRFRTAVESAPDGVTILRGRTIVYINRLGARMLGYAQPSEALGRGVTDLMSASDAQKAAQRIGELFRSGNRYSEPGEYRSRHVDGREITVEISSVPIEFEGLPAVLAFARDITERKAIQEKLVQADRLAAVGTLAAGIAHEINNPLAYVQLGLQYLERELPKLAREPERIDDVLSRLREVRSGAERVGTIVRDLKTFARADEVARGPVDLRAAIEASLKIADNEIRHRARLVRDYDDVPPVDGNSARIEQVFLNLFVNATHALSEASSDASEIRVSLRASTNGAVVAEVTDNGTGIPPDVLSRVFDPFFTTKPVGVGTGLGLPICRSIVEGFGGQVDILSEVGKGTTARVTLPVYSRAADGAAEEKPRPLSSRPPDNRRRVLIVDDEPLVASLLRRMLAPQHDVLIATSAQEALRAIDEGSFDAIVCDVMMPGMTGMDLYSTLRQRDRALSERIVFMTGGAFMPRVAEFLARVDNPKVEKPFDLETLRGALRQAVLRGADAVGSPIMSAGGSTPVGFGSPSDP
jgi:PAS domain S-box-containing protein